VWGIEWIVIAAMVALNSVFAAYEIALASVSLARLQLLVRENRTGARAAVWMKENMEASLAAVQLGITLVGATAAATGGAGATEMIAPYFERMGLSSGWAEFLAIATVVVPLSAVTILLGELFPKVFALRNKEWVCLRLSPEMRWFSFAVWPAVWLFESVVTGMMSWGETRWQAKLDRHAASEAAELGELRAIAALARTSRLIGGREENIIIQAARLSSRPVVEIMLPVEHIATLNLSGTMADSLVAAHMDMHTRFPVCERDGDRQSIMGYVNFKDIVAQLKLSPREPSLQSILRPIPNFSDDAPLSACLGRMIREHTHIALVRDPAHRIVGMITLEDILEELVGDIQDEFDRLPAHVVASGRSWVVGGGISLPRLKELTGIDLACDQPPTEAVTLNDWVAGHVGRTVCGGDVIERNGRRVLVRKIRRQKVLEAQVSQEPMIAETNGLARVQPGEQAARTAGDSHGRSGNES
jgi:putative hemolysin